MGELSTRNFGLLIAFVAPGFVVLAGMAFHHPAVHAWLYGPTGHGPAIGSVLYVLIASVALGLVVSAARWILVDTAHHATGLRRPASSDRTLGDNIAAYTWLIENYYRYYQFYANTLVALIFAYAAWRGSLPDPVAEVGWLDASIAAMLAVLFAGSRSALSRFYRREGDLLAHTDQEDHHDERRTTQEEGRRHQATHRGPRPRQTRCRRRRQTRQGR